MVYLVVLLTWDSALPVLMPFCCQRMHVFIYLHNFFVCVCKVLRDCSHKRGKENQSKVFFVVDLARPHAPGGKRQPRPWCKFGCCRQMYYLIDFSYVKVLRQLIHCVMSYVSIPDFISVICIVLKSIVTS